MPFLFAFRENRFGFRFEIGESATLGRSPECDLIIFDRATSRKHAQIYRSDNGYILEDLNSTNGTLHNSARVNGAVPLKKNDEIKVGQEVFLFDPALDVALGREGAVLMVGDVGANPAGVVIGPGEVDLATMDRNYFTPLLQMALALAQRPNKGRILKQTAYALSKLYGASTIVLLWPDHKESRRLSALLARPREQRLVLPMPLVEKVLKDHNSVIWPYSYVELDFVNGERRLKTAPHMAMAVPLKSHGELFGLLYVDSPSRHYTHKDLNTLAALGGLLGPTLVNAGLLSQLDYRLAQDEEEQAAGSSIVGNDQQIKALMGTVYQVSQTDARILITGEVGTGKEMLARRIHSQSQRRRGPFISINCSAVPPGQLESALFGQENESSGDGIPGLLEQADGGTIFIRHIEHLSLSGQGELLRSIEEGLLYRVGSSMPRPSSFRTISSTCADLETMVRLGDFRADLLQRLSEVTLTMPPLRELHNDIVTLAHHFLDRSARDRGVQPPDLDPAVAMCLQAYPWPGNIGELKNICDMLVMFARSKRIVVDDLPLELRLSPQAFKSFDGEPESQNLAEVERTLVHRALARSAGNADLTAEILGLPRTQVEDLIRRYAVSEE
ncbi:MAG: sigma 54-interacting transcriptional regulator [Deltaproteobacteria bacterium]|nr:sigma 54-interacting transcriptional regulator [Deltaproteobacteria bacterium]